MKAKIIQKIQSALDSMKNNTVNNEIKTKYKNNEVDLEKAIVENTKIKQKELESYLNQNEKKILKIEEEIHKIMNANLDEAINKMTEKNKLIIWLKKQLKKK